MAGFRRCLNARLVAPAFVKSSPKKAIFLLSVETALAIDRTEVFFAFQCAVHPSDGLFATDSRWPFHDSGEATPAFESGHTPPVLVCLPVDPLQSLFSSRKTASPPPTLTGLSARFWQARAHSPNNRFKQQKSRPYRFLHSIRSYACEL